MEKKILNSKDFPENTFEMNELAENIKHRLFGLDPVSALTLLANSFPGKIVFSTSFGWEDQVITHMIFSNNMYSLMICKHHVKVLINVNIIW